MNKLPLVIINSPTATGKTKLAMDLALAFGGEVINADSLQVYRYLDIGTAKPTVEERNKVKHHLIDVVDPDEEFNAAVFTELAHKIIENIAESRKPVFIAGGTGLYIRALLKGIIDTPKVDENIRNYYRQLRNSQGKEFLYNLLRQRDKEAAARINPNDSVRVIRALEVLEQTGESIVDIQKRHAFRDNNYNTCKIGLKIDREELKKRIAARTDKMIAAGLLDEARDLLERGYGADLKPLQSLGYKQMTDFLSGKNDWEKAVHLIKQETWLYAKRQMTWFAADHEISWYSPEQSDEINKSVKLFLKAAERD
ncbi:MAG: tRNA (adenosine(37)-N6)-dimethylallyltransferase MiaA [Deltaproteobacteria bacterium HGW-Deltaproteobacteria-10]|nr:MAG: tRNA (adenosine(37)-N6)-dimethylallyltransferase MiaA [Deltaproteobacteria bacterium HGW-Deltaproteobacteria-10]